MSEVIELSDYDVEVLTAAARRAEEAAVEKFGSDTELEALRNFMEITLDTLGVTQ